MAIDQSVNKALNQANFKSLRSGNVSGSGRGSSYNSNVICHKRGKKGNHQKDCKSKRNGYGGNPYKKSTDELPEWVTRKPIVSDTKDMATSTMTHNNKKHKW